MVEDNNNIASLKTIKTGDQITKENLVTELFRIELVFKRLDTPRDAKVDLVLENCSNEILEWWIGEERRPTSWESFKSLVLEEFTPKFTLNDLIKSVQKKNETLEQFITRVKTDARKCRASNDVIIATIQSGIRAKSIPFLLATKELTEIDAIMDIAKLLDKETGNIEEIENENISENTIENKVTTNKGKSYISESLKNYTNKYIKKEMINTISEGEDKRNRNVMINNKSFDYILSIGSSKSIIEIDNSKLVCHTNTHKETLETYRNKKLKNEKILIKKIKARDKLDPYHKVSLKRRGCCGVKNIMCAQPLHYKVCTAT